MTIYNNLMNWSKKKTEQFKAILAEPNPSQKATSGAVKTLNSLWSTLKATGKFLQSLFYTGTGLGKMPYHAGLASHAVYTALGAEQDKEATAAWGAAKLEGIEIKKAGNQVWDQGTLSLGNGYETLSHLTETTFDALETGVHTVHALSNGLKTTGNAVAKTPELIARAAQVVSDFGRKLNQAFSEQVATAKSYLPAFKSSATSETTSSLQPSSSETELVNLSRLST